MKALDRSLQYPGEVLLQKVDNIIKILFPLLYIEENSLKQPVSMSCTLSICLLTPLKEWDSDSVLSTLHNFQNLTKHSISIRPC